MSETKFTPGPWYPVEYGGYWSIQKDDSYSKDDDLLDEEKCDQATSNAKLAAAAPEMYTIIEELLRIYKKYANDNPSEDMTADYARDVLNKINSHD